MPRLTDTFAGYVNASTAKHLTGTIKAGAGPIVLTLDWANTGANLNLFLKNSKGVELARAVTRSKPERIAYTLPADGDYKVTVGAAAGASNFTVTIDREQQAVAADPPPDKTYPGAGNVKAYSLQFMENYSAKPTQAEAVTMAEAFDVVVAHNRKLTPHVDAMHKANPDCRIYCYQNATFCWQTDLPEAYYAHDATGKRITAKDWGNTYLMRPELAGYQAWFIDEGRRLLEESRYDGLYVDVLGPAAVDPGYVSAVPVDPATGAPYTRDSWLADTAALAAATVTALAPAPVLGNGSVNGQNWYRDPGGTRALDGTGMVGLEPESWLRGATSPIGAYPSEAVWKQNVDMLAAVTPVFTCTKVWTAASVEEKQRWHDFALASFLLGNTGSDQFHFTYEKADGWRVFPRNSVSLGDGLGAYFEAGGCYQRNFTKGRVLVNPTNSEVTVQLPAGAGYTVGAITLPANRSAILYRAA
jgi:Hypothetical glycosyl hydrolase family 15